MTKAPTKLCVTIINADGNRQIMFVYGLDYLLYAHPPVKVIGATRVDEPAQSITVGAGRG